ncbi:MAG: MarR family winged helix-turn-helix transcriptional regulator [Alphaproteobacteria bacterium]
MTFQKAASAGYLANHMARLFARGLRDRIAPLGIVPGQFAILIALWEQDGQTQSTLANNLDIEQPTTARTLVRMERDGLVIRKPHPTDARSQQVWLSARARDLRDAATAAATRQNEVALADLTPAERARFVDLMGRVIATLRHQD